MENICVPACVDHQPQIKAGDLRFVHYTEKDSPGKNRVIFNDCAISFVLNGQKEIFRSADRAVITATQGMLIPAGNTLIAEHTLNQQQYSSFILFFPQQYIISFLNRVAPKKNKAATPAEKPPYLLFSRTGYINEYLHGLINLVADGTPLSGALANHKLEELFLALYELYPGDMAALFDQQLTDEHLLLRKLVENNLFTQLTIQELAFLAHRSLSSFKRDCLQVLGMPPQQYMRERRLALLCQELSKGKHPGDLYLHYGYENLSNMNTAFKRKYGITPSAYRQACLS